jgi:arginase
MITLIEVPYHMGTEDAGVGRGPGRLLAGGADKAVAVSGQPEVVHVRKRDPSAGGLDGVVDVNRQLRYAVEEARASGRFPIVLSGDCNASLGTLAGIGCERTGVVWLDAHGDFHTPATSRSGSLDGMALAAVVGDCHEELRLRIGGQFSAAEEDVVLVGCRDLEPRETERLVDSRVTVRPFGAPLDDLPAVLSGLRVDALYLHLDVDVLGGLVLDEVDAIVREVVRATPLAAVGMANYNPAYDPSENTLQAALHLLHSIAALQAVRVP